MLGKPCFPHLCVPKQSLGTSGKVNNKSGTMRSRYKISEENGIYFVTSTITEGLPVFTSEKYFKIMVRSLHFCKENKGLKLHAYVILDNHFHLVASAPDLSKTMTSMKNYTAHEIIKQLKEDKKDWLLNQLAFYKKRHKKESTHQIWQEGYHPQVLIDENMLIQKIDYMHHNPVK